MGVAGVQFHLNGTNLGAEDTTNSYALPWDTTTVPDGTYTLTATARDAAGNTTTSAPIAVTVTNTSPPPPPPSGVLLSEDFLSKNLAGWKVVDEGTTASPSAWSASTSMLMQSANIWGGSTSRARLPKPGTFLYYANGLGWTNYQATFTLRSTDNDALGLMIRYQDPQNYYRFSWDRSRRYRRLVKVQNGLATLLAEDAQPYSSGQTYHVDIRGQGNQLEVRIDNVLVLTATEASLTRGSLAFYSWGNAGSIFDDLLIRQ
jgi:hypothetical protein